MSSENVSPLPAKAVVLLSGGLDSTVLLYHLQSLGTEVLALSVDYGQRHRKELEAACAVTAAAGVPHQIADLSGVTPMLAESTLSASPQ